MVVGKVMRVQYRIKTITSIFVGIIFFILGIVMSVILKSYGPLIFSVIGLIGFAVGWLNWKMAQKIKF